ncbi:MAG: hypothetical protein Q8N38_00620 [Bacteroidales bacterium]|nr:hypothetical protein [Bacteroidales bacterium]
MNNKITISVNFPTDKNGMIGRECLECKRYFKIKPGTGLPTDYCHCPYCDYEGKSDTFLTQDQIEYVESIAYKKVYQQFIKPSLDKLKDSFKELERSTRNSLIKIKVTTKESGFDFPTKYYTEKELETVVTCDSCGLEFAIYGVFSKCPDCRELNAFVIFEKSLEITQKQLAVFSKPEVPRDIIDQTYGFILSSSIAVFDGLGKELRLRNPDIYPSDPKNLFQNILLLDQKLNNLISSKHSNFRQLLKLFQVRHLYEHNLGVIDNDFITKLPEFKKMVGMKYILTHDELNNFIALMRELGEIIKEQFNQNK